MAKRRSRVCTAAATGDKRARIRIARDHVAGQRRYTEHAPAVPLRGFVACYWRFWVEGGSAAEGLLEHPVPPDGGVSVVCRLVDGEYSRAVLYGAQTEPRIAEVLSTEDFRGVRLWPGVAARAFDLDAVAMVNDARPLEILAPALEGEMRRLTWSSEHWPRELDAVVARRFADVEPDRLIMKSVARILEARGTLSIGALVESSGLSERQFQRRFRDAVGMSAKQLARVRRVRAAAIAALESDDPLAAVAHDGGFADQAHMIREFRRLIGQAPSEFRARIRAIEHGHYDK